MFVLRFGDTFLILGCGLRLLPITAALHGDVEHNPTNLTGTNQHTACELMSERLVSEGEIVSE